MKKLISLILVLSMMSSFTACGESETSSSDISESSSSSQVEETTEETTAEITTKETTTEKKTTEVTTIISSSEIDYKNAKSFEDALNNGTDVKGKIVKFDAKEYHPDSALGINCWSGQHLNFISETDPDVKEGYFVIGRVTEQPKKVLVSSWNIPYEILSIEKSTKQENIKNNLNKRVSLGDVSFLVSSDWAPLMPEVKDDNLTRKYWYQEDDGFFFVDIIKLDTKNFMLDKESISEFFCDAVYEGFLESEGIKDYSDWEHINIAGFEGMYWDFTMSNYNCKARTYTFTDFENSYSITFMKEKNNNTTILSDYIEEIVKSIEVDKKGAEDTTQPEKTEKIPEPTKEQTKTTIIETTTAEPVTEAPTEAPTEPDPIPEPEPEPETKPVHEPEPEPNLEPEIIHFIINGDTGCVHTEETCRAAQKILAENYSTIDIPEEEIANYSGTYWACGICAKKYGDLLPKFE